MVESKSLKLYLFSFRNHGDFHEDCVNIIMKDLIRLMDPKYIEVWGKFTPRGGISIDPYCNYGKRYIMGKVAFDRLTHHDMYPERSIIVSPLPHSAKEGFPIHINCHTPPAHLARYHIPVNVWHRG